MPELKINPIVPDDDEPSRPRRSPKSPAKPKTERGDDERPRSPTIKGTKEEDPTEEEDDFDPKAVEEEVKKRYGIENVKVQKLQRSRSGAKTHKTGSTRR